MNQISSRTRWPLDPRSTIERAIRDIHFADAMTRIMGGHPMLRRMALEAKRRINQVVLDDKKSRR